MTEPLGHNRAVAFYNHVLAIDAHNETIKDAQDDKKARMKIVKKDGIDPKAFNYVIQRRKDGAAQAMAFDDMVREYEQAVQSVERGELAAPEEPQDDNVDHPNVTDHHDDPF